MNIFIKKLFSILSVFLLCFPFLANAADLFFDSNGNQFVTGGEFVVSVKVDTKDQSINAIEGIINFPLDLVDIKEIRDGNSVINLWIERPNVYKEGSVKFSGITPGGFSGANNTLFSVILRATDVGNGAIYGSGLRSLLNDGVGTNIQVKNQSLPVIISVNTVQASQNDLSIEEQDLELPESFTPIITSDPSIFDGKYFLVFATQDKMSGIDYFEVKEGFGFYVKANSLYLLHNQNLDRDIYIKAVDKAGNKRVVIIKAQNTSSWLEPGVMFAIIVIIWGLWFKKRCQKFTR